jgi:hypothetical protein
MPAQPAENVHALEFVNAATEPVYAIRIGHRAAGTWSEDLLGPAQVVEVGEAERVSVRLVGTCWYDVRFQFSDGHAAELDDVDLCSATRLFVRESAR